MAQPRGIRRIVELALDRASARRMRDQAQDALDKGTDPRKARRNLSHVESGFGRLKASAVAIGAALIGASAAVVAFGASAIRAFTEADEVWNRLAGTLRNAGVEFSAVRGEIEGAARAMQDVTTVGDEDFAGILQELVSTSNDYAASLRNVQVVADLAAAKQLDFRTAAQLVGRAMVGQTGTLSRYGIVVEKGADAVELMRTRFKGMAEQEAKTLGGQVKQLSNEWGDFKEAIGAAMVEAGGGTSIMETLIGVVKGATQWVNENSQTLATWATYIAKAGEFLIWIGRRASENIGTIIEWVVLAGMKFEIWGAQITLWGFKFAETLADKFADGARSISRFSDFLSRIPSGLQAMFGLTSMGTGSLSRWADALADGIRRGVDVAERNLIRLQATYDAYTQNLERGPGPTGRTTQYGAGRMPRNNAPAAPRGSARTEPTASAATPRTVNTDMAGSITPIDVRGWAMLEDARAREAAFQEMVDGWRDAHQQMESLAQNAAQNVSAAWGDAFTLLFEGGANLQSFMQAVGEGMARALLSGLAEYAGVKVAENIASGFEMLAKSAALLSKGDLPLAAAAKKSAVGHFLAAGKWGIMAGAAGAAGAAIGGGGGGYSGRDAGHDTARDAERRGPEVHVYIDPLDPHNPAYQGNVYAAQEFARERYGDGARVYTHPRRR